MLNRFKGTSVVFRDGPNRDFRCYPFRVSYGVFGAVLIRVLFFLLNRLLKSRGFQFYVEGE